MIMANSQMQPYRKGLFTLRQRDLKSYCVYKSAHQASFTLNLKELLAIQTSVSYP